MFLRKLELGNDETLMQFMELVENCETGLVTVGFLDGKKNSSVMDSLKFLYILLAEQNRFCP